jgi:hypothetical protein
LDGENIALVYLSFSRPSLGIGESICKCCIPEVSALSGSPIVYKDCGVDKRETELGAETSIEPPLGVGDLDISSSIDGYRPEAGRLNLVKVGMSDSPCSNVDDLTEDRAVDLEGLAGCSKEERR